MSNFNDEFARETWSLYVIGILIIALRFWARAKKLGVRNLQADDYLMTSATIWYTILVVSINKIIFGGGSNLLTPVEEADLSPESVQERIAGSKWVFVSEHAMVLTIWSLKLSMLFIYRRLTDGLQQKKLISFLFLWVACGFVGTELCLFLACRPFPQYWAVPPSDLQCATYQHYEITELIFNTSSDIFMLIIGIPLLLSVQLPLQQKSILLIVFGMGVFVIVAAVLTKIYCLLPSLLSYVYLNWYFREASVSVYVTNLPALWSLIRDASPSLRRWGFASRESSTSGKQWPSSMHIGGNNRASANDFPLQPFNRLGSNGVDFPVSFSQNHKHIFDRDPSRIHHEPLKIKREITFTVEKDSVHGDMERGEPGWQKYAETRCTASPFLG